jgi:hypothetical protein
MHRVVPLALLGPLLVSLPAFAEDDMKGQPGRPVDKGAIGVGIVVGEPLGICAKIYLRDDRAIQAAIGSALIANGYQIHADYVLHPWIVQDRDVFVMPIYVGPGVRFIDYSGGSGGSSHAAFGVRGVAGLMFDFKTVPLDAFLEVAAIVEYDSGDGKGFGAALNAGAGLRYYF